MSFTQKQPIPDPKTRISPQTVEELLLDIFGGNPYFARARERNGDITYEPIDVPIDLPTIREHMKGIDKVGTYQLIQGANVVKWLGWDVDSPDLKKARDIVCRIVKRIGEVPHCIEFSGGKGYHVLIFLKEPIMASDAKKVVDWVREVEQFAASGTEHVECFPKQDRLTKSRPKGNLLKMPLGEHPRTHDRSRFVDPLNGWENGRDLNPIEILQYRASKGEVAGIIEQGPPVDEQLVKLLADYWIPGKRHEIALYLSGFLAHEQWSIDSAKDLMRDICLVTGDDEEFNRLQTIENTFQRHHEGKAVRGRQGLGEILPVTAMQKLTELVAAMRSPNTVIQIDDIRYDRTRPNLENARLAANTIWSFVNDEGCRVFQTDMHEAYWYNAMDHTVVREDAEMWKSILNKMFGLNPADGFSRLVMAEIHLRILREAPMVPVHRSSFWADEEGKLYINLGGPEVYILNGTNQIERSFNGECGLMFITNESGKYIVPDFDGGQDCWEHLVNDMSFTSSPDAPAKPEEQRELLKAWIMAFFFQELMPTKPILAMLGQPGSGKTTSIRRILRMVEDPDADVLGVPTDKQDAFRASIAGHRLLVLDNLEKSGAGWMVDMLNKLATGSVIELRMLYKTNEKMVIRPQCFVACTAVNMPFSDETLFSRLLVLEMEQLEEPLPEHVIQRRIREYGPTIWGSLLTRLNEAVAQIKVTRDSVPPTRSRLADFTVFCNRIKGVSFIDAERLRLGLLSMVNSQLRQLEESSQAIVLLEQWLGENAKEAAEWHDFRQLYSILSTMAQKKRQDFKWHSAQGLGRHFLALETRLRADFFAEIKSVAGANGRDNLLIRFRNVGEAATGGKNGSGEKKVPV